MCRKERTTDDDENEDEKKEVEDATAELDAARQKRRDEGNGTSTARREPEGWRSVGGASKASAGGGSVVAGACGRDATRRGVSVSPQSTSSRRDACVFSLVGFANLTRLACLATA